ncbi:MAG: mechanosensitive ion channel family protein [Acetilactobacillus jinshanensis]
MDLKTDGHFLYQSLIPKESKKVSTLHTLSINALSYGLVIFWIYSVLSLIGIPVGTLITGAGIFSLAIGLGAQGFVSDIVSGFFILFEHQLNVGDYVQIGEIQGTVKAIGLRTTQVTSIDGTLNYIPNRNITVISNFSRNNMTAIIQIKINPDTPIKKSLNIIKAVNQSHAAITLISLGPQILEEL